jgi:hypothetical protein
MSYDPYNRQEAADHAAAEEAVRLAAAEAAHLEAAHLEAARLEAARLEAVAVEQREQEKRELAKTNQVCGRHGNASPGGGPCALCIWEDHIAEQGERGTVGSSGSSDVYATLGSSDVYANSSPEDAGVGAIVVDPEDHHIFPQEWEWYFKQIPGFDIHEWTMTISAEKHRQIHRWWNMEWALWIFEHERPTLADVENKAVELLESAGIQEEWMHSYRMRREKLEEKLEAKNICPVCSTKTPGGTRCQACLNNELLSFFPFSSQP